MILGDNIFYGNGLFARMDNAKRMAEQGIATVFGYYVRDPKDLGWLNSIRRVKYCP